MCGGCVGVCGEVCVGVVGVGVCVGVCFFVWLSVLIRFGGDHQSHFRNSIGYHNISLFLIFMRSHLPVC